MVVPSSRESDSGHWWSRSGNGWLGCCTGGGSGHSRRSSQLFKSVLQKINCVLEHCCVEVWFIWYALTHLCGAPVLGLAPVAKSYSVGGLSQSYNLLTLVDHQAFRRELASRGISASSSLGYFPLSLSFDAAVPPAPGLHLLLLSFMV